MLFSRLGTGKSLTFFTVHYQENPASCRVDVEIKGKQALIILSGSVCASADSWGKCRDVGMGVILCAVELQ
jgi:hypothetical protein